MTTHNLIPLNGISVICPVKDLLRSGRNGSFRRLIDTYARYKSDKSEIIIVEGLHTDKTGDFISEVTEGYKEVNIVRVTEEKKGIYPAINTGARRAAFEGLTFMGSDDFFLKDGLDQILRSTRLAADYYYWTQCVDMGENYQLEPPKSPSRIVFGNFFCFQSFLIRKSVFLAMGGFSEELSICADYDLAFRLVASGRTGRRIKLTTTVIDRNGESSDVEKLKEEYLMVMANRFRDLLHLDADKAESIVSRGGVSSTQYLELFRMAPNWRIRRAAIRGLVRNLEGAIKEFRLA